MDKTLNNPAQGRFLVSSGQSGLHFGLCNAPPLNSVSPVLKLNP